MKLKKPQVVHCPTEQEAIKCCQLAKNLGLTWYNKREYDETNWNHYQEDTCYDFGIGEYSDLSWYNTYGYKIITSQEFIDMHTKEDEYSEVPRVFCMRGNSERCEEIEEMFIERGYETDELLFQRSDVLYFGSPGNTQVECICDNTDFAKWFISTQTITELPEIEPEKETVEFWLKLGGYTVYREIEADEWELHFVSTTNVCRGGEGYDIYLPFTQETEKLIGTTNAPDIDYKLLGVKSFFE